MGSKVYMLGVKPEDRVTLKAMILMMMTSGGCRILSLGELEFVNKIIKNIIIKNLNCTREFY